MSRYGVFFLIILASALLQVTVLNPLSVWGVKPDLLLLCMILASFYLEFKWALLLSMCAGGLKDIFGLESWGIHTLLCAFWCVCIIKISRKISIPNNLIRSGLVLVIVIAYNVVLRCVFFSMGNPVSLGISLRIVTVESLYTVLALPLMYKISSRFLEQAEDEAEQDLEPDLEEDL
jgi:rod shape-determining protein MreD